MAVGPDVQKSTVMTANTSPITSSKTPNKMSMRSIFTMLSIAVRALRFVTIMDLGGRAGRLDGGERLPDLVRVRGAFGYDP